MIILNVFRRSVFEDDHLSLFCLLFFLQQPTLSDMTMYEMNFFSVGGRHIEEHCFAWVQADHCGGEAQCVPATALTYFTTLEFVIWHIRLLYDPVLCLWWPERSCWWWCQLCWKETQSWSFRRLWIWTGWLMMPLLTFRKTLADWMDLRNRWGQIKYVKAF